MSQQTHDTTPSAPGAGPGAGMNTGMILTVVGAALMILAVFLNWLGGGPAGFDTKATIIPIDALWSTDITEEASFITSVGALVILWAVLALIGLATRNGGLSRLGGALGLITVVLFAITLFRAGGGFENIGLGMWIVLLGSILVLVGGFVGARRVVSPAV